MGVTLDNIADLKNGSNYYLSDSGEIKKSGLIHKFKCCFNLGHSRQRVANLINEIQKTLLASAGLPVNRQLNAQLSQIDMTKAVKGQEIKNIAAQFRSVNSQQINENTASSIAKGLINKTVVDIQAKNGGQTRNTEALCSLLNKAVSDILKNPPLVKDKHNNNVVDKDALINMLNDRLYHENKFLLKVAGSQELGKPKLTTSYLSYLKDNAYDKQGNRIVEDVTALKNQFEAEKEIILKACEVRENKREAFDENIDYLLEQGQNDADLHELLMANARGIVLGGKSEPRSLDSLKNKIDGIKSNLAEIRSLAPKDQHMSNYAFRVLKGMLGKSLPDGMFTRLYNATLNADISNLSALNSKSSQWEIFKGIEDERSAIATILNEQGVNDLLKGKDVLIDDEERHPLEQFIEDILVSRLSIKQQQGVRQAFLSVNNVKQQSFYNKLLEAGSERFPHIPKGSGDILYAMIVKLQRYSITLHSTVCGQLGLDAPNEIPDYINPNPDEFSADENSIYNSLTRSLKDEIKYQMESYVDIMMQGNALSQQKTYLKEKMVDTFSKAGLRLKPSLIFKLLVKKDFSSLLNVDIIEGLKLLRKGKFEETSFFRDIKRDFNVTLPDGKMLDKDPLVARDELAQFVSKDPEKTYDDLDEKTKDKVNVLISVIAQTTFMSMNKGMMTVLDPDRRGPLLETHGNKDESNENYTMSLYMDPDGNVSVDANYSSNFSMYYFNEQNSRDQMCDPKSKRTAKVSFTLTNENFDKISKMNLDNYPAEEIDKILRNKGEYRNINNRHDAILQKLPPELAVDVKLDFAKLTLDIKD